MLVLQDFRTCFLCWLALLVVLLAQCAAYDIFVLSSRAVHIFSNLGWYLEDWGVWLLFGPALFRVLRSIAQSLSIRVGHLLGACALVLLGAIASEVLVKYLVNSDVDYPKFFLFFLPRYSLALIGLAVVWCFKNPEIIFTARKSQPSSMHTQETSTQSTDSTSPAKFYVSKGNQKLAISSCDIQGIVADRNYLEIYCADGIFLLRETLKNMESLLPEQEFVRTHRSAMVRKTAIARIKKAFAGKSTLVLNSGAELPVNKQFLASHKTFH